VLPVYRATWLWPGKLAFVPVSRYPVGREGSNASEVGWTATAFAISITQRSS
jgi:hypothetical protein